MSSERMQKMQQNCSNIHFVMTVCFNTVKYYRLLFLSFKKMIHFQWDLSGGWNGLMTLPFVSIGEYALG